MKGVAFTGLSDASAARRMRRLRKRRREGIQLVARVPVDGPTVEALVRAGLLPKYQMGCPDAIEGAVDPALSYRALRGGHA